MYNTPYGTVCLTSSSPSSEGNPGRFVCSCKSCKNYGICSHILAVNHIRKDFDVRRHLLTFGKRKVSATRGKGRLAPAPALQHASQPDPGSSDEEQERLQLLGAQGL